MARTAIPVDLDDLAAAKRKLRTLTSQIEKGERPVSDLLHPAYKVQQFLHDALGSAWDTCDTRAPDDASQLFGD